MAKTCVVNRDENNRITSVLVRNPNVTYVNTNLTVYRGGKGNRSESRSGVLYFTSNRSYANFYETGSEKISNKERYKERAQEIYNDYFTEKPDISIVGKTITPNRDIAFYYDKFEDIYSEIEDLLSDEEKKQVTDIESLKNLISESLESKDNSYEYKTKWQSIYDLVVSDLGGPETKYTREQYDRDLQKYEQWVETYEPQYKLLEERYNNYLSPSYLLGKGFSLNIDFKKDKASEIFEKLKKLGVTNTFKGGNFLDNYEQDLIDFARDRGINYYKNIQGGIAGSLNADTSDEFIVISNEGYTSKNKYDNSSGPLQIATERNNGYDLSLAPNGKPSLLYQTYINEIGMTEEEAKQEVSKIYSDEFLASFGDFINKPGNSSRVVDENNQPKLVWSGHPEKVENYKAYTNREEEDRIDNDAFFPEDKTVADSYANAGFQMTREQAAKYKLPYKDAQPVFLNIRNPQNVEENSGLLITPLIEEAITKGNDGFYGNTIHRTDSKTWSVLDGSQVIPAESLSLPKPSEQLATDNGFIPSKLYNQVREIPFINEEQALDFYKNIYRPEMSFWQESDNENLDEETKEPKLYFRGDNGNIYTNLSETLKNSSNSFSVGFLNAEGVFTSYLESPIYSEEDIKGKAQSLVKNDYLKPTEKEENTFEAQDSLAAEMIEEDLAITNPFSYERNGNNFTVEEAEPTKTYNQLVKEVGVISATRLSLVNKFFDLKNRAIKPKEVLYNENQLYNAIQSFMKRLGISETTIDNYKERYEAKFGIEPDANAFIDINNKIIATINGKATLDELSEEVSHFIIEAWNQEEIVRLLPYVKNTSYYAQFAETYREIYSKQISDANDVENYVNKEILGKMLAESMKNNFSLENKTEVERNFFERLGDILRNFINYIQNKITPKEVSDIDFFTKQVSNLLYNQELEANLERLNPQSTAQIMYSISPRMDAILKRFGKQISRTINSGDLTEESLAIRGATTIFNDNLIKADSLLDEVKKYVDSDTVIPSTIDILVSDLLGKREDLELLRTEALREINRKPELKDLLSSTRQLADMTLQKIAELSGEVQLISSREPEIVAQELLNEIGENRRVVVDSVIDSVRGAQRDTNWLGMNFAHVGKMSNAFISLMNQIVKRMLNKAEIDTNADFDTYAQKLLPYQQKLKNFFKGGSFISNVDNDKITEDKIKFEYQLRKEAGDETLDEISEEDFIKDYSNIDKLDKNSKAYYIYDALYKERYSSQDWADTTLIPYYDNFIKNMKQIIGEEGLREGDSALYVTLKNYSDRRSKYREGDPLRKSENEQIAIDRKSASNIFNKDGSFKEGLSYMRYSDAKAQGIQDSDIVSNNPRLEYSENDFVVVIDRNLAKPTVGKLAFDMLKWNSLNLSEKGDKNLLKENFKNEYNKKLRSLQNLNYNDRNTQLRDWIKENLQFDMSDEYWENLDFEGINFEGLKNVVSVSTREDISRKETELNTLKLQRANILKLYKAVGDYKEIAADKIPSDDKLAIEKLEIEILKLKNDLSKIFDEYGIKMYSQESQPIIELNQSFYEIFERETGTRYEDSSFNQKRTFFSGQYGMSSERYAMFINFQKLLNQDHTLSSRAERQINKYRNLAKDPADNESIQEAYLKANAPSWYKRYDANTEYGNFVRDFNIGAISVEGLVNDYLETDSFNYNGSPLEMMQINPGFKFTLARNATTSELYEEYKNMPDGTVTDLKNKFNQLMVMGGNMNLKNIAKQDLSFITDNEENLRVYVYMMDYHLRSLDVSNSLTQNNVFTRPQKRKGGLERYQTIVTKGDKVNQLKDALKEKFQYREDDFEDAYKSQQLPKYGLYRVDPSELTDDILGSLIWFNAQSNNYDSRMKSYGLALKAMSALSNQSFDKGKQGVETNYYKVAKGMLDYNFYGKTTTMKIETNILGHKIDLAKVLMGFKGFAITQALAFSPIVALTNVISGVTQNQFLKWTGKNIYSPADDRAQMILAPLTSNSTSDIGKLAPTTKLNKLMYQFGVYNIEERFKNADFNRTARLLPEAGFGMMAVGNFLLQSRVVLSKLMEVRLVDGKFQSWRDYTLEQKRLNPNATNSELKSKFNEAKEKSMYDYLDDDGKFQTEKLEADGYNGDIENDKLRVVSRIQDIGEQVTMEIRKHNEGEAARSPFWSFALSLKKWLILANTQMFSRRRLDLESGGEEEGLVFSYKNMFDLVNRARKENISMAQAYRELDEVQQKNIRSTGIITASMTVLLALAFMLKKLADDDDEKDNYALQLGSYLTLRSLNEAFSGNLGVPSSLYESLQNPISTISVLKNITKVADVRDIGEENKSGKYKGVDKYLTSWIKLTSAKNLFTLKDAETVGLTRQSYSHFNIEGSLYHIFSLLPDKSKDDN